MEKQLIGCGVVWVVIGKLGYLSYRCIRLGGDHQRGRGSFGGKCEASHCNQWDFVA